MNTTIEDIKKHIDIVDFIGSYIPLKKAGRNFKANCPFHQEKTPSFVISPDRQIWHCFGACQIGGDIITFLMKWDNITFFEALKDLSKKTGIPLKNLDFSDEVSKKREIIFDINRKTTDYYNYILKKHEIGEKAREYLIERKISDKIIDTFSIGYSPSSWTSLTDYLTKKSIPLKQAVEAGLIIQSNTGRYFDRFRKRVIFPLFDHRGNVAGFSGRVIDQEKTNAKYINTPETYVYHKREILYGLNLNKETIKKKNSVIVTEGELDMISLFQNGISNAVAVKGSAVTKEQLMLLKRYTNKLILSLDSDTAGEETTKRSIADAESLDFEITVASIDWAKDPNEAMLKDPIAYKKVLSNPQPIYDFVIESVLNKYKEKDAYSIKKIGDEVISYLTLIRNPIVKTFYVKKLATIIDSDISSIEQRLRQYNRKKAPITASMIIADDKQEESRYELLQKYILYLVLLSKDPEEKLKLLSKTIDEGDFSTPALSKLFNLIKENTQVLTEKNDISIRIQNLAKIMPKELLPIFDRIILFYHEDLKDKVEKNEFLKLVYECKRASIKKKIESITSSKNEEKATKDLALLHIKLSSIEKKLAML